MFEYENDTFKDMLAQHFCNDADQKSINIVIKLNEDYKDEEAYDFIYNYMKENNPDILKSVYRDIGFKFIQELTKQYDILNEKSNDNKYNVFLHGGAELYIHGINKLGKQLPLNDIDFKINSLNDKDNEEIYNNLIIFTVNFCNKYEISFRLKKEHSFFKDINKLHDISSIFLTYKGEDIIELNYFINQSEYQSLETNANSEFHNVKLYDMFLTNLKTVYFMNKNELEDFKIIIDAWDSGDYSVSDKDEIELFKEKLSRHQPYIDLLTEYI